MGRKLRLSVKGTLCFLILFGLTLWAWSFFRSYLLFLAMILMVGSVLASFFLLWFHRGNLQAQVLLPSGRVGRDTPFQLCVRAYNAGKLVGFTADITYSWKNMFTGFGESKKEHVWMKPAGGNESKGILNSRYAGRVEACVEEFVVYDFFHIFCLRGCEKGSASVTVWPGFSDGEEQEELFSSVEGFPKENESKKRGTDYNPDYEIREYVPGDELKTIHWKLSAKQSKLMVRERLASGREKINVVLPLGEERAENDGLMEALYGLGRLLLQKEYPVQLFWMGQEQRLQTRFIAEIGEFENALGEILSTSGIHQSGLAEEQMRVEHPGESYILIQTGAYKGAYIQ
ncbi:MAG: DUF58 domain-containing protein [Acetatifactor sp.]|nr:DUF58 domain-containing protein [Acetatifactor sp.]